MDSIRIRKCANPKCSDIIGVWERPNKKYCSQDCKTQAHNDLIKLEKVTWEKIIERHNNISEKTEETFLIWLTKNYYPPKRIKIKRIEL